MEAKGQPSAQDNGLMAQSILAANLLTYKLAPDVSVASARNNQSQFFANQSYAGGATAVCILNTGSQYVHPRRSYLAFTVTPTWTGGGTAWFGPNGSACNLINRITISSRSGTVIELLQNANMLASHTLNYRHDRTWRGDPIYISGSSSASVAGVGGDALMYGAAPVRTALTLLADSVVGWVSGAPMRFCIPLPELSPFCANSKQLWPASLASGMRIELLLEQFGTAFMTSAAATVTSYDISNIRIEAECYQLSDLVLRSLNDQASESALDVVSMTAWDTVFSRTQTSVNVDCSKAVSRAIGFLYRERAAAPSTDGSVDAFACPAVTATVYPTDFQARLGGLFFPQSSIRSGTAFRTAATELYAISLQSLGHMGWGASGVATNLQEYYLSRFCVYQSMERSDVIDLSGQPMSNARLLNVQASFAGSTPSPAISGDLFLFYVILVRCFLSGTNIEV